MFALKEMILVSYVIFSVFNSLSYSVFYYSLAGQHYPREDH